jgi:hypothetical protein
MNSNKVQASKQAQGLCVRKKQLEIFIAIFCSRIQWGNTQPYEIQIWYYAGQREKKIQFETGHR